MPGSPLLTIAVPTYNRAAYLREFLAELAPQLRALADPADVEILVSDNASTDDTPAVLDAFRDIGIQVTRQPENIGSDRNFVFLFRQARGRYFWLCGDDDILRPGAVDAVLAALRTVDYDWIFLPPEPFQHDWRTEFQPDPHHRTTQAVHSARQMALHVNVMLTFITGMVVHRERLLTLHAPPPEDFIGTNLTQLAWTLPFLRDYRQSLILWQRFVLGRQMNSGGYSLAQVFGAGFVDVVRRLLPDRPRIAAIFLNLALRQWFPATVLQLRQADRGSSFQFHEADALLTRTFRRNFRFWLFTWPVLRLPLPLAAAWVRIGHATNRALRLVQHPGGVATKVRSRLRAKTL